MMFMFILAPTRGEVSVPGRPLGKSSLGGVFFLGLFLGAGEFGFEDCRAPPRLVVFKPSFLKASFLSSTMYHSPPLPGSWGSRGILAKAWFKDRL